MGKLRKGHNWKARQITETTIDNSESKKINVKVDDVTDRAENYDASNPLVLPSKKRKTAAVASAAPLPLILSKKQRKKLERVLQQKEKKSKREELLKSLAEVQASKEEMELLISTTGMQTKGVKRIVEETEKTRMKANAIAGSNKRQKTSPPPPDEQESSSSVSSSDEDEEDDEKAERNDDETLGDAAEKETRELEAGKEDATAAKNAVVAGSQAEMKNLEEEEKSEARKAEDRKPALFVPVTRTPEVQASRLALPILAEEQQIMEAVHDNPVIIVCGETGSGKTTQVPQFLYEGGYASGKGIIGVTEPRRVAATSMSQRVGKEMSMSSREVSYQIRYQGNATVATRIKFMTDGVLLREAQSDFLLTRYSVVVIDEAHERSSYTDILIGLLSRIVPLRHKRGNPLKLIIMSATLRVEDFTENKRLFKVTPPVIRVESRQYPVTIHFNKRTPDDYLAEAFRKTCKIHQQLPDGGILVFVTGQQEVHTLVRKLRATFPFSSSSASTQKKADVKKADVAKQKSSKQMTATTTQPDMAKRSPAPPAVLLPDINLDSYSILPPDEEEAYELDRTDADSEIGDLDSDDDDDANADAATCRADASMPLWVLPLYSLLSPNKQSQVFEPPPEGARLVVVSTNVAETSLTIPNIKYVVDTGKVKVKLYDRVTGVSSFKVAWTAKSASNQRSGRAGRTSPGHCYRLYSSAIFNDEFERFSQPEILRRPVDDLVLQMKDMNIDKVMNFPFPTPPAEKALKVAERHLVNLGALSPPPPPPTGRRKVALPRSSVLSSSSGKITPLGRAMACFPVAPRYGKMLALAHQHALLPYVVVVVAALSVQELFEENYRPPADDAEQEAMKQMRLKLVNLRRGWAGQGNSLLLGDLMVLLKAVGAFEYGGGQQEFCVANGLRYKAMLEVRKLRTQLINAVNTVIPGEDLYFDPKMAPPSDLQAKLLRQVALASLTDRIARRWPDSGINDPEERKRLRGAYQCQELADPVFMHPSAVLCRKLPPSQYIIYQDIVETSKMFVRGVVEIEVDWIPLYAPSLCTFSKPQEEPAPRFRETDGVVVCHMSCSFGRGSWQIPLTELPYPAGLDRYRWFARFLLEGGVCPKLRKFAAAMLTSPATMVKSWAKLQPKTEVLLKALVAESVDCRDSLHVVWRRDTKFLLATYLDWLPESLSNEVRSIWPPL